MAIRNVNTRNDNVVIVVVTIIIVDIVECRIHQCDFLIVTQRRFGGGGGGGFGAGALIGASGDGVVVGGLDGPSSLAEALICHCADEKMRRLEIVWVG